MFCLQIFLLLRSAARTYKHAHTPSHPDMQEHRQRHKHTLALCVFVIKSLCAIKCFMASQDETAPKVNRLALDIKFSGFSMLFTYECFSHRSLMGFLHMFICSFLFPAEKSAESFAFIKYLTSLIVHKILIWVMYGSFLLLPLHHFLWGQCYSSSEAV